MIGWPGGVWGGLVVFGWPNGVWVAWWCLKWLRGVWGGLVVSGMSGVSLWPYALWGGLG